MRYAAFDMQVYTLKYSCSPSCKSTGQCCSDYDSIDCSLLVEKSLHVNESLCRKSQNCQLCDDHIFVKEGIPQCNQCAGGTFLYEGQCLGVCPKGTTTNYLNYTCNRDNSKYDLI